MARANTVSVTDRQTKRHGQTLVNYKHKDANKKATQPLITSIAVI